MVNYNDLGNNFYIVIQGSVSVWEARRYAEMKAPLEQFKKEVMKCVNTSIENKAPEFKFHFHMDPFI